MEQRVTYDVAQYPKRVIIDDAEQDAMVARLLEVMREMKQHGVSLQQHPIELMLQGTDVSAKLHLSFGGRKQPRAMFVHHND